VERKGILLQLELTSGLPYLWLDRVRIRQVLSNLLSNAARVTTQGTITLRTESRDGEVVVAVADTGPGIEREDLEAIFTEFFQADRVEGQSGRVGLGLAVSKQIILLHGGRIWAESEVGRGSTFYFGFTLESDTVSPLIRGKPLLPFRPPRPTIVVIGREDAEEVRFLRRHLDDEFTLVAAIGWEDAQRMVRQSNARAVIANVLPDEAVGLEKNFTVPLITCPVPGPTQIARLLGVDAFVQKPVVSGTLRAVLRGLPVQPKSLLLVDDEPAAVRLIERIIQSSDPDIRTARAYSGQDAWARIQAQRPDAVVLDLTMANGDGFWLITRLRQHETTAQIPVIAVSGRAVEDLWQTGMIGIAGGNNFTATEVLGYLRALLKALPPAGVEPRTTLQPALEMRLV
jgi:CheY-like chemotaxis protein